VKSIWEKKLYTEVCSQEARKDIILWKMDIWRLKGVTRNNEQGMCPVCNKEEGWSYILTSREIRSWKEELADKRFTSTDPEI
jgi:hypothetical protein